jgi:hypothetical protein
VLADGLPADVNEREAFCMEHIQMGETLAADPARTLDAALAFYKALKVYPTPNDLISIYDKVVDKVSATACNTPRHPTFLFPAGTRKCARRGENPREAVLPFPLLVLGLAASWRTRTPFFFILTASTTACA